jgi:hypothetical protein
MQRWLKDNSETRLLGTVAVALLTLGAALPASPAPTRRSLPAQEGGTLPQAAPADSGFTTLELGESSDFPGGKMVLVTGEVGSGGQRFRLGDLNGMQAVLAYVAGVDESVDMHLTLLKPGQDRPTLTGSTGDAGWVRLSTRTWGGLDLLVEGPEPSSSFALVVWVSDELQPNLGDVVVTPAEFRTWAVAQPPSSLPDALADAAAEIQPQTNAGGGSGGGSSNGLLLLGAFLAGGLLVLITVLATRRRNG